MRSELICPGFAFALLSTENFPVRLFLYALLLLDPVRLIFPTFCFLSFTVTVTVTEHCVCVHCTAYSLLIFLSC